MKRFAVSILSTLLAMGLLSSASAADLSVGDQAPDFTLKGSDGKSHTLSKYKGQTVIVAWFPKAFTGG